MKYYYSLLLLFAPCLGNPPTSQKQNTATLQNTLKRIKSRITLASFVRLQRQQQPIAAATPSQQVNSPNPAMTQK